MLEIKATNSAFFNSRSVNKLQDIITKLDTSLFKAIVTAKVAQESYMIHTALGKAQILTDAPLQQGDELSLKVIGDKASQSLELVKIERPTTATANTKAIQPSVVINNKSDLLLLQNKPDHFVSKVVAQDAKQVTIKPLVGEPITLSKEPFNKAEISIKTGDFITIKKTSPQQFEAYPLSKLQLLTQTQQQLLPKQLPETQPFKLLSQAAFKLLQSIKNELQLATMQHKASKEAAQESLSGKNTALPDASTAVKTDHSHSSHTPTKVLNEQTPVVKAEHHALHQTIKDVAKNITLLLAQHKLVPKMFNMESLSQLMSQLTQLQQGSALPQTATQTLLPQLTKINEHLEQLLLVTQDNGQVKKPKEDDAFIELFKTMVKELKQPLELTINKLLFQNVSSKLNLETQNTLVLQTQIPIEINKQTQDANISIKQHKKKTEQDSESWEIDLSFEFGSLGLISSKILLRDHTQLNIQFWAELSNTKQLIENKQDIFKQQIANSGFALEHIAIFLGKNKDEPANLPPTQHKPLIDITV